MELLESFLVPKATGKAFVVKAGQILRITQPDGPQVIDFDAFSLEDPRENLLTSATRRYGPSHVTTGDTLWSGGLRERRRRAAEDGSADVDLVPPAGPGRAVVGVAAVSALLC